MKFTAKIYLLALIDLTFSYRRVMKMSDRAQNRNENPKNEFVDNDSYANPWLVDFKQDFSPNSKPLCIGTIIAKNWIITAANCFYQIGRYNPEMPVLIFTGSRTKTNPNLSFYLTQIDSANIHIHHLYSKNNLMIKNHDIALVDIPAGLVFTDLVRPIEISTDFNFLKDLKNDGDGDFYTIRSGFVDRLGWKKMDLISDELCSDYYDYWIYNQLVSNYDQNQAHRIDYISYEYFDGEFTSTMTCVRSNKKIESDCKETEIGQPLIHYNPRDKKLELIGIMSWGEACVGDGSPGIFTKLSSLIEWLPETRGILRQLNQFFDFDLQEL